MFLDCNIPSTIPVEVKIEIIEELISCKIAQTSKLTNSVGYIGIVWNHTTRKITPQDAWPENYIKGLEAKAGEKANLVSQLEHHSRLTLILDDPNQMHSLNAQNNPALQRYDILAVQPSTEKLFHSCCQTLEVDIISLDLSKKSDYPFKKHVVKMATTRGVCFELTYSIALKDTAQRRQFLSNALKLVQLTKGKNIILSSQAQSALDVRGPNDLINLGILLGMSPEIAKSTITSYPRSCILHAATRKTQKGVLTIRPVSQVLQDPREAWKIPETEMDIVNQEPEQEPAPKKSPAQKTNNNNNNNSGKEESNKKRKKINNG